MRSRGFILSVLLLALLGSSCSSALSDDPAANRAVGEESPDWDAQQAIRRTQVLEANMDNGLSRGQAACVIDTVTGSDDYTLEDIEDVDFTTKTGPGVRDDDLAAELGDALIECGESLRAELAVDIPGALSIPATYAVASECVGNAYTEAWRAEYTSAFGISHAADDDPVEPSVADQVVDIVDGCEAGGAIILGASANGHNDVAALSTLEWICLVDELDAADFIPAFPFPEEPGDALDRLGDDVTPAAQFCRDWVGANSAQERAEVEAAYR